MKTSLTCAFVSLLPLISAQYILEDDYEPSSFASMFDFFTAADPTNGYVTYVDQETAESTGLFSTSNGTVYMGVDSTNVASGSGRSSLRLTSQKSYNQGLVILDLAHMPGGQCGSWPAFWMLGPDWPNNGELDIIENVNSATTNIMTLHTDSGCTISSSGTFSGLVTTDNCDVNAPNQATNQGCSIQSSNTATYGVGFNENGGGIYATEWTSLGISIWYFPRSAIPSDILAGTPTPENWGMPLSTFSGGCDIDEHVDNMQIVFDTTFCGDWAGNAWSTDATCSPLGATCVDYVQNNPSAFVETYWSVNSLKVYQQSGSQASSPAVLTFTPTATVAPSNGLPTTTIYATATTTEPLLPSPSTFTISPSYTSYTESIISSYSASSPSTWSTTTSVSTSISTWSTFIQTPTTLTTFTTAAWTTSSNGPSGNTWSQWGQNTQPTGWSEWQGSPGGNWPGSPAGWGQ